MDEDICSLQLDFSLTSHASAQGMSLFTATCGLMERYKYLTEDFKINHLMWLSLKRQSRVLSYKHPAAAPSQKKSGSDEVFGFVFNFLPTGTSNHIKIHNNSLKSC